MNRIKDYQQLNDNIVRWIGDYVLENPSIKSLAVS